MGKILTNESSRDPEVSGTQHARILIVDDEPHVCEILSRWLMEEGHDCATAASGEQAWELLQQGDYSLLVSDIMMPGMTGIDLFLMIKERFPDVATIMVTAVNDRDTAIRTLKLGCYGYVIKPFEQNEVVISVANALERRRLTLASRDYGRRLEREVRERTEDIREREEEIAMRLVAASEYRDVETGAHIRRIGLYGSILAEALGWGLEAADDMRIAGPMHDIGKISVPDVILLKPGKLTPGEFDAMKKHTVVGGEILAPSGVPLVQMAKDIALSHHEKWDGSGYPNAATGDSIPESARVVAVADVYDALTHRRVYRPALPEEEALAIMTKGKGRHFDPRIFERFMDVLPALRRVREQVADRSDDFRGRDAVRMVQ